MYNHLVRYVRTQWMLKPDWITEKKLSIHLLGQQVIDQPSSLIVSILIAFSLHLLQILSLLCVTFAFQQHLTIGMLITAYAMTMLLVMISVVPQGVGLVEGVLTVLLTSFGLDLQIALAVMVVYRSISFGLPAIIGFTLLHQLKTFQTT